LTILQERLLESEPDLPLIDDGVEDPEEFFRVQALALSISSPQRMQQLWSPGNSEASYNFPAAPVLETDPNIDMVSFLVRFSNYNLALFAETDEFGNEIHRDYCGS